MGARCTNNSKATAAVTIGIAAGFAVLVALLVLFGDGNDSGNAVPFMVIMMGSAAAIGVSSSRGDGCCCVSRLFKRSKKVATDPVASKDPESNPYAPDRRV